MKVTTAKELKSRTGEALRYAARGGKVLITRRGKAVAVLGPANDAGAMVPAALRPFHEAWAAIEAQLKASPPRFATWRKAVPWSRRRG